MRKIIHLPKEESSNYSSSDEIEPIAEGVLEFKKGVPTVVLPIKLRENMKTMREKCSLYLYEPGGDKLAHIAITVLNNSGVPGKRRLVNFYLVLLLIKNFFNLLKIFKKFYSPDKFFLDYTVWFIFRPCFEDILC